MSVSVSPNVCPASRGSFVLQAHAAHVLGVVHSWRGEASTALPLLRRAVEVRGRLLGEEATDTLASVGCLAMVMEELRQFEQAEGLHRRCLVACERTLGADHVDTIASAANLAEVLVQQGGLHEAVELLERCLDHEERKHEHEVCGEDGSRQTVPGFEHADALDVASRLASVLDRIGHGDATYRAKALELYERVYVFLPCRGSSAPVLVVLVQTQCPV